jgi:hypothetical protein
VNEFDLALVAFVAGSPHQIRIQAGESMTVGPIHEPLPKANPIFGDAVNEYWAASFGTGDRCSDLKMVRCGARPTQ